MEEPTNMIDECEQCNNSNTLVFTVARMNPPTPGHLELIREMLTFASKHGINKVYIFVYTFFSYGRGKIFINKLL